MPSKSRQAQPSIYHCLSRWTTGVMCVSSGETYDGRNSCHRYVVNIVYKQNFKPYCPPGLPTCQLFGRGVFSSQGSWLNWALRSDYLIAPSRVTGQHEVIFAVVKTYKHIAPSSPLWSTSEASQNQGTISRLRTVLSLIGRNAPASKSKAISLSSQNESPYTAKDDARICPTYPRLPASGVPAGTPTSASWACM